MVGIGRSAGGLLVGAVANMFPQYFRALVAGVPFVDVLTTISDPSIPLTVTEWEEWGNSNEAKFHDYMRSYSPYDNLQCDSKDYPNMLVTAGLNDPRVAYWEPAKWVAKMRHLTNLTEKTRPFSSSSSPPPPPSATPSSSTPSSSSSRRLFLRTDMTAGHFSASDRYKLLRTRAFEYSFVLEEMGLSSKQ
jgi:oligopeptidase B